jgi:pimeloyl-ACP methyl ester carboxylesterase
MEEWRKNMGIDQMILTGHSMGGYLSVAYAERHPQSLHRLLLVSPVGLPDADPRTLERVANAPWYFRLGFSMWKSGYSPMAVPGTWWMLGFHGNNRYNDASWTTKELLRQYFYYNWCNGDPSAGARTHATLLTPGAYARNPLHARVPQLVGKVARISCIYGDKDWMGHYHFESVKKKINDAAVAAGETTMPIDVTRVADGGHNMMVDNPEGFLDAFWTIQEACKNDRENGTGMKDGQIFGQEAWMHERRIANALVKGASVEGRSKDPNGSKPYMWTKCEIIEANGNGTFKVRWKEGNDAGKISSNFGGHLLKLDEV